MPACVSSLIPSAVDQAGIDSVVGREVPADLLTVLGRVPDPRARRGVRHRLTVILGIGVCAMLGGARSFTAIAEWARDLTPAVRSGLGIGRAAPSETAIRRTLQAVDPELLDQAVSSWLSARRCPGEAWRVIALDGKTARGARIGDARAVHLLAAFDVADGGVLAQTVVDGKTNEITAFAPLLDRLDITGAVITADALHTQHRHAEYLHRRGAHYVLTVKGNQPGLHRELKTLPWRDIPAVDVTHDKGHARIESRTVKLTEVAAGIGFPHACLAIQITRRRRALTGNKRHTETVYAITDLSYDQISAQQLAGILRSHWTIENRLHWIRDVVFAEDLSQIRTGHGPAVMATLRNLAISIHRRAGATNIAAATRHVSRHPSRVLPLLTQDPQHGT
jgi:predicted transposase YbfD/YdcC